MAKPFNHHIKYLQDFMAKINSYSTSPLTSEIGGQNFKAAPDLSKAAQARALEEKIDAAVFKITKEAGLPPVLDNYCATLPLIIKEVSDRAEEDPMMAYVLRNLVVASLLSVISLLQFFYRIHYKLANLKRNPDMKEGLLNYKLVDYIRLMQIIGWFVPVSPVFNPPSRRIYAELEPLFKAVESEQLYSSIFGRFQKMGSYWRAQSERDLINQGRSIPEEILSERLKEQTKAIDMMHFFKILMDMRSDQENQKYNYWRVNYLFANFLFSKYVNIFEELELIFLSMIPICQNADDQSRVLAPREQEYRIRMLSLFRSVIDVYSVLFKTMQNGLSQFMAATKKVSVETKKTYLKSIKIVSFFQNSGQKTLLNAPGKKKRDHVNFKFFKILLERCPQFKEFVTFVYRPEIESSLDVLEFQYIVILHQLLTEGEERKAKALEALSAPVREKETPSDAANQMEEDHRLALQLAGEPGMESQDQNTPLMESKPHLFRERPQRGEAILYEVEETQERPRGKEAFDQKTREYLEKVRGLQYEDEFDDTHETDAQKHFSKKKRGERKAYQPKHSSSEEEGSDEDAEDLDPMDRAEWGERPEREEAPRGRRGRGRGTDRGRGRGRGDRPQKNRDQR